MPNRGFTIIETIVVLAIFSLLFSLGLFMSFDLFKGYTNRSEKETIATLLEKARSNAMNGVQTSSWGLCFDVPKKAYVLFRSQYAPTDSSNQSFPASTNAGVSMTPAAFNCAFGGIIFAAGSGATSSSTIKIFQGGHSQNIAIYETGAIAQ